ncbi:MAG: NAD(P)H-dependent oxidoreductase [Planctomycetaceae bacterium]|nr:NAD(P)H-dependent oxidoreductase [Planctomycetaceae bacterium]
MSDHPVGPPKFLVISSSLHPTSRSRLMAKVALEQMRGIVAGATGADAGSWVEWVDLADVSLPICDGHSAYRDPAVGFLSGLITGARGILIASPIYNYDVNANLKNLIELTGRAWQDKVVGLMCAAGGAGSYMSLMPFANSLMLDFRCLILPRFVYATGGAFTHDSVEDPEILHRIEALVDQLVTVTNALAKA